MAAPTLTLTEQISSLAAKRRRGKKMKNMLGIPKNIQVVAQVIGGREALKLTEFLHRLLPAAKLENLPSHKIKKGEVKCKTSENSKANQEAQEKRNQLSLGVNSLSRDIKKKLIAAAVLANDIHPKILISHVNLLCSNNQIPFVYMTKLRQITKTNLGFPCIAIGFKKNSRHFSEIIDIITASRKVTTYQSILQSEEKNESNDEETQEISFLFKKETPEDALPFTYLYRSSTDKRVFVPEVSKTLPPRSEQDFVPVSSQNESEKKQNYFIQSGILKTRKRHLNFEEFCASASEDEEDEYSLPERAKKFKKDWVIDTVGDRQNFQYSSASVLKVYSNPERPQKK